MNSADKKGLNFLLVDWVGLVYPKPSNLRREMVWRVGKGGLEAKNVVSAFFLIDLKIMENWSLQKLFTLLKYE